MIQHQEKITSRDWKFCAVVDLGIQNIKEEQHIDFNEHFIRIFKPKDKAVHGFFVAEVYSLKPKYNDNITAFHNSIEILNKVLDRISIATFRYCKIISSIGITQFKAERNKPFKMLLTTDVITHPPKKVFDAQEYSELFQDIREQELNDSISEFSLGINSSSIYLKFSHFYNCIERVAQLFTTENVKYKCKSCGESNETPIKATGNKMKDLFKIKGYNTKEFKKCRSIRGKIAHGSGARTKNFNDDIFSNLPIVESVALHVIEKYTSLKLIEGEIFPRSNDQFVELTGKKRWNKNIFSNAAYDIIDHCIKFSFVMHEIGNCKMKEGFITDHIPMNPNPWNSNIFPYAWPY